jgi:hypothetical protein
MLPPAPRRPTLQEREEISRILGKAVLNVAGREKRGDVAIGSMWFLPLCYAFPVLVCKSHLADATDPQTLGAIRATSERPTKTIVSRSAERRTKMARNTL